MEKLLCFPRTHCTKLALPDIVSHLQAFFYKLKRKKNEPMASWCTRYTNEYTKVRRALARLQRTESTEESELQRPYFSVQGGQVWNWSEHHSEEVMEWDGCSDAGSNAWSRWHWSTWNETQTMHIQDYDEGPHLFPEPVLAFFSTKEWPGSKREKHDTGCNK